MQNNSDFNLTKPAYAVNDLLELLPIGRTRLYAAIRCGDLRATKYGKRTWFLADDVAAFLNKIREGQHG